MYDSVNELANQYARLNEHINLQKKVEDLISKDKMENRLWCKQKLVDLL